MAPLVELQVHWPVYIPGSPETNPEGAGVLTLKNVAISGGVLRTFGLPAATRRNLHMLLKSPDRPASSTPIRTVHSDSAFPSGSALLNTA